MRNKNIKYFSCEAKSAEKMKSIKSKKKKKSVLDDFEFMKMKI
jgi:hypothetical protein